MTKWSERFHELANSLEHRDYHSQIENELNLAAHALCDAKDRASGPYSVEVETRIPGLEVHYTSPGYEGDDFTFRYGAPVCVNMPPNPLVRWVNGCMCTLSRKVKAFRDA